MACSRAWAVRVMRGSVRSGIASFSHDLHSATAPALIHVSNSYPKGLVMAPHGAISPQEAADRLAIRELVDAYAHCADRRDATGQMALFTKDTRFLVFYDLTSEAPSQELHGRESLAPVFDDLNQYVATMHFNGQSTIALDGDRASGESYCLAHHLSVAQDGQRTLMVASIRYLDEFVKQDGQWLFAERRLMVNWIDTRPSTSLFKTRLRPARSPGCTRTGRASRRSSRCWDRKRSTRGAAFPGSARPAGRRWRDRAARPRNARTPPPGSATRRRRAQGPGRPRSPCTRPGPGTGSSGGPRRPAS